MLRLKDIYREVMPPGEHTKLFFSLKRQPALPGHQPCKICRRGAYNRFNALCLSANPNDPARTENSMAKIDKALHEERVDHIRQERVWSAALGGLPESAMVAPESSESVLLMWHGEL